MSKVGVNHRSPIARKLWLPLPCKEYWINRVRTIQYLITHGPPYVGVLYPEENLSLVKWISFMIYCRFCWTQLQNMYAGVHFCYRSLNLVHNCKFKCLPWFMGLQTIGNYCNYQSFSFHWSMQQNISWRQNVASLAELQLARRLFKWPFLLNFC